MDDSLNIKTIIQNDGQIENLKYEVYKLNSSYDDKILNFRDLQNEMINLQQTQAMVKGLMWRIPKKEEPFIIVYESEPIWGIRLVLETLNPNYKEE